MIGDNDCPLSPKTVRNVWISFHSFFHWVGEEFDYPNPMLKVSPPKFEMAPVEAFSRDEIETLLIACEHSIESRSDQLGNSACVARLHCVIA